MGLGPGFASSTDTFVPSFDGSGRLIIGYSRNPKKFVLPNYVQYVPCPQSVGYFLKLSPQEAARVVTPQEYEWPDGQVRPFHADGVEQFNFIEFRTHRYDYGFTIGKMAVDQATWGIVEQHSQIHAAKLMTARTIRMLNVLTTASNWTIAGTTATEADLSADHTATATVLAGGQFDLGTSTNPYVKKAFDKVAVLVNKDTLGVVTADQLAFIMNPNQARLIAESPEVHDYIKGSYHTMQELKSGIGRNSRFGLPETLYGYPIFIEDTVQVTSRKGATLAKSFAMPDQTILAVSRVGGLEGVYGSPSFSTATLFYFQDESTLERFDDPKNRLVEAHVVENTAEVLTSPLSGYLITATTSVPS